MLNNCNVVNLLMNHFKSLSSHVKIGALEIIISEITEIFSNGLGLQLLHWFCVKVNLSLTNTSGIPHEIHGSWWIIWIVEMSKRVGVKHIF